MYQLILHPADCLEETLLVHIFMVWDWIYRRHSGSVSWSLNVELQPDGREENKTPLLKTWISASGTSFNSEVSLGHLRVLDK